MWGNRFKRLLAKATIGCLLLSLIIPNSVLAENLVQNTYQGNIQSHMVTHNLTPEQIEAMNNIMIESEVKISPQINVHSADPVRIIVQFKQDPVEVAVVQQSLAGNRISLTEATKEVNETHKKFKEFVQALEQQKNGISFKATTQPIIEITNEYKHAFNGVSMILPGIDVEKLLDSGLVSQIFEDRVVQLDSSEFESSDFTNLPFGNEQDTSLPSENEQNTSSTTSDEQPSETAQMNSQDTLKENTIPLPGIEDLHNSGITGKGIKVGVLDTGIDYNHPDLTNVYKGYRKKDGEDPKSIDPATVKGWDFVDNDADPMETTYEDWVKSGEPDYGEPTYYTSHGTHVSGTIAAQGANNVDYPALGVAPGVELYGYRVLGPYGSGYSSDIIAGIDKSVHDGMDVINLSLGSTMNDPLIPESIAINNATIAGVTCVIAAGNTGPNEKTMGSPGTAALGITVGASDFPMAIPTVTATVSSDVYFDMKLLGRSFHDDLNTLENKSYPIVNVGLGGEEDYLDANGQPIDLPGTVALIQRGTYTFVDKIVNAKKAGAVAVIIYNNVDGEIDSYLAQDINLIPSFRITKAEGESLLESVGAPITFTSVGTFVTEGNYLADFSSRGPVNRSYDIKPDVVGPGVSVYSTYPAYVNSPEDATDYSTAYARISGTSMASPHVAGIAALLLQAHPDYKPSDVKAALMNTAGKLSIDYSVYEAGAGLVSVTDAVYADVSIKVMDKTQTVDKNGDLVSIDEETGSISYGTIYGKENATNEESRRIVIKNRGHELKEFNISYEFTSARNGVADAVSNLVEMVTSSQSITVAAGTTADLAATIRIPGSAEKGRYEGYVNIINSTNPLESYRLPFAVRVVDKGIQYIELDVPAISTVIWDPFHPFFMGEMRFLAFRLNSPVNTVRAIIYDKDGRPLGSSSLDPIDAETAPLDEELFLFITPHYYPFVGDPKEEKTDMDQPLAELPEGQYTLKFRAVEENGKTYELEHLFVIDNTLPELTFKDQVPRVYELQDSDFTEETLNGNAYNAFWVHANVYDEGTELLAPLGITQSANTLWYYHNQKVFPDGDFPIDDNGDVKFGIEKEDIENGPTTIILFPMDVATNAHLLNEFYSYAFVKAGTPYVVPTYDKHKVYKNDTLTMTLNLHNVEQLMSGKYDVGFYKDYFEFVDVTVNPEFQSYAEQHGLTVSVDQPVVNLHPVWESKDMVNVGAQISGAGFEGFTGDIAFMDVTFKLIDDHFHILADKMDGEENTKTFSYTKFGESSPTTITSFTQIDGYKIIPKHSHVVSYMHLDAFAENWSKDFTEVGAKVYAQGSNGEKYPGTVDQYGYIDIMDIPLSNDPYDIVVEAPGHLKSIQKVKLGAKTTWGEDIGQYLYTAGYQPTALAGDVNGDGVIDVLDVKQVAGKFGQQKNVNFDIEDLNQDGIVDVEDMYFLVKNLYESNTDATVTPQEIVDGKYSTDFFNMLGIASPINTLKHNAKSKNSVELSWLTAVDATDVKIEQSNDNGATWNVATTEKRVTVDANNAVVTGLLENTSYQFRVKVVGGLNAGISNVVSVTIGEYVPPVDPKPEDPTPSSPTPPVTSPKEVDAGDSRVAEKKNTDGTTSATATVSGEAVSKQLTGNEETVTVDLSNVTFDTYKDVNVTLDKSTTDKLLVSGKNLVITHDGFSITIPANALKDFVGKDGLSIIISITNAGKAATVSIQAVNKSTIVSPVVTISNDTGQLNQSIEITLKLESKSVTDTRKVSAYQKSDNGNWEYVGSTATRKGGNLVLKITTLGSFAAIEYAPTFADITKHWAKDEIEVVAALHVTKGTGENTFSPEATITKAEFQALLDRIMGKGKEWGEYAKMAGASDVLGREDMVIMMVNALGVDLSKQDTTLSFNDKDSVTANAKAAVAYAVNNGLIKGVDGNKFAPQQSSSRSQVAVILYRLMNQMGKF